MTPLVVLAVIPVFKVYIWGPRNTMWFEGPCPSIGGPISLSSFHYNLITKLCSAHDTTKILHKRIMD